jgi:hypothetical protein
MTIWRMRIACWMTKTADTHTHTLIIFNTYCLSTTKVVTRTPLYVCLDDSGSIDRCSLIANNFAVHAS